MAESCHWRSLCACVRRGRISRGEIFVRAGISIPPINPVPKASAKTDFAKRNPNKKPFLLSDIAPPPQSGAAWRAGCGEPPRFLTIQNGAGTGTNLTLSQNEPIVVRTEGLEPSRRYRLRILSPVCLPVPPRPRRPELMAAQATKRNMGDRLILPRHVWLSPTEGAASEGMSKT